jgi:RHH-type proline utilization regulon transcriptional repressor/proline dehydrogenase/delta 1-pyrroline-5-carboxylate dehydrogenase
MISAALLAGNAIVAKPAGQSALILYRLFELMFDAGVPTAVAQLLPGSGSSIGNSLVQHSQLACVTFTGSYATARHINQQLAARPGPMIPLIAETGGQNAMLVDSSALPEQVVQDVISSAFDSAGQRCSALRVLYLQAEIADKVIQLLAGAMAELTVGNPAELSTDVGPVIDPSAMQRLQQHRHWLSRHGRFIAAAPLTSAAESLAAQGQASFFAPCLFEIDSINQLGEENFGPILHVIRYPAKKLLAVVEEINSSGYGLTFGIHSRNQHTMDAVCQRINAGNIYINRNMVAAVVGSQPFGGLAMSGTGPKAGGPDYLRRLCHEQVISDNVAAVGGNVPLLVKRE